MMLAERLALRCAACHGEVLIETEMPGEQETDQTTDVESLQAMLDALGGVYCADCMEVGRATRQD